MKKLYFLILLGLISVIFMAGCRQRQTISPANRAQSLRQIERCNIGNMSVSVDMGGRSINLISKVQFVRDSMFTMSLLPLGIEIGYLEICGDRYTVIDKINHRYAQGTLDELSSIEAIKPLLQSGNGINMNSIVDIILGRIPSPPFSMTKDFPPSSASLRYQDYNINVQYEQWVADNNVLIPMVTTFNVSGKRSLTITFKINKITLQNAGKMRNITTAKYQRTLISNILNF